jgi:hypothetical protein
MPSVRSRLGLSAERPPAYVAGQTIDVPSRLYDASPRTLLLFVRANCSACQTAKPAFASLVAEARGRGMPVWLVASGALTDEEGAYAASIGLEADRRMTMPLAGLRLQVVPTLVVVGHSGEVVYAAEGVPTDTVRRDVIEVLTARQSDR